MKGLHQLSNLPQKIRDPNRVLLPAEGTLLSTNANVQNTHL